MQHQLDHCPARHLKRAALILIAVDIEPGLVLSAIRSSQTYILPLISTTRAQWQSGGTGYRVAAGRRCSLPMRLCTACSPFCPGTVL